MRCTVIPALIAQDSQQTPGFRNIKLYNDVLILLHAVGEIYFSMLLELKMTGSSKDTPVLNRENMSYFITEQELAKLTGISLSKIRNDRSKLRGFPYYKINKSVRYKLSDIFEWLETKRVEPLQD